MVTISTEHVSLHRRSRALLTGVISVVGRPHGCKSSFGRQPVKQNAGDACRKTVNSAETDLLKAHLPTVTLTVAASTKIVTPLKLSNDPGVEGLMSSLRNDCANVTPPMTAAKLICTPCSS